MLGCSADGFDRYLVSFNLATNSNMYPRKSAKGVEIVLDALSGTCASSYDDTKCGLDMAFEVHEITQPWNPETVTWTTQPSFGRDPIGKLDHFSSDYQEKTDHPWVGIDPKYFRSPETLQTGGNISYGFVIIVPNDTETTRREQRMLHDDPTRVCGRGIQRDVLVGNPRLEVRYK